MKKKVIIVIVILILILILILLIGGILFTINNQKSINKTFPKEGIISNIEYRIYSEYELSSNYKERGYYIDTLNHLNAPYFYVITLGEKPTGGYSVEIVDLKIDKEKNVEVIVKEIEPEPENIVTMAFTYPSCCLELSEAAKTITIKNTDKEEFAYLG